MYICVVVSVTIFYANLLRATPSDVRPILLALAVLVGWLDEPALTLARLGRVAVAGVT